MNYDEPTARERRQWLWQDIRAGLLIGIICATVLVVVFMT